MEENSPSTYTVIKYPGLELPECYRNMIFSKWLRSLRYGNDMFKLIDPESYYSAYSRQVQFVLSRKEALVRLAVLTDNHDVALGFSVSRGNVLDIVHVQKDMRKQGIGSALFPDGIAWFTSLTKTALGIWGSNDKYKSLKFDPFR